MGYIERKVYHHKITYLGEHCVLGDGLISSIKSVTRGYLLQQSENLDCI